MVSPAAPPATRLYDTPAPWPWRDTAVAVVLYVGVDWIDAALVRMGWLPRWSSTHLVIVLLARTAVTLGWVRLVYVRAGTTATTALFGLQARLTDVPIGAVAALAILFVEAWVSFIVVRLLGEPASRSAWQDIANTVGRPAFLVIVVVAIATAPVTEELVFRGMLLRTLAATMPPGKALFVAAAIFGAVHLSPNVPWQANIDVFLSIAAVGLGLGLLARLSDRLGPGIVAHTLSLVIGFATIWTTMR